jgi:hypothetical protein
LVEIATKNPNFLAVVSQEFPGFPYFFVPEEMAAMPMPEEVPGLLAAQGMPPGPSMAPQGLPPDTMAPGIESQMPPIEGMAPGAEMLPPEGAPVA